MVRARARAGLHGQARDRLLADDRGPAAPRQPRDASTAAGSIHLAKVDHNTEPHRRLLAKLKGLLGARSAATRRSIPSWSVLDQRIPLAGVAHQCGTVRFGTDPATSALDVDCKAHDLDNLYVVDTSFFPSSQRGEPGADGDGQRAARRRPPASSASARAVERRAAEEVAA